MHPVVSAETITVDFNQVRGPSLRQGSTVALEEMKMILSCDGQAVQTKKLSVEQIEARRELIQMVIKKSSSALLTRCCEE